MSLSLKKYFLFLITLLFIVNLVSIGYAAGSGSITSDDIKHQLNQVTGNTSNASAEEQIKTQGSNILRYLALITGFIFIALIVFAGIKLGIAIDERDRSSTLKWLIAIIAAIIIVASAPFIYNWAINASFK
ncbi:hypothetical protein [Caldanaerobacter subterraneus]|uniref:Uncharacterized protein n=1 Tax=Caldanaerobacter subterraneus TaxID=911092 RepID=A0A7Y2L697_9THEO|nr:hypothetical protein [Caldanaerobacter subterraneus]NNG66437.1 hypothetical protein [Caldanaerobacter subterraneus]